MSRYLGLLVLTVAMLTVPASTGVTYQQAGYDAGRTGAVPFELPGANDTAFQLQLPGTPTGTVAIDGRTAYLVTLDHGYEVENRSLDENALWSIDLDTAQVTKRFEIFDERPDWSTAFTDGERVYTQVEREVTAYDLDGNELWTWDVPNRLPRAEHVTCFDDPAFRAGTMHLACLELRERHVQGQEREEIPHTNLALASLDVTTGEPAWVWFESPDMDPDGCGACNVNENGSLMEQAPAESADVLNAEVTATEDRVFVYALAYNRFRAYGSVDPLGTGEVGEKFSDRFYLLWGLDAGDGRFMIYESLESDTSLRHHLGVADGGRFLDEKLLDARLASTTTHAALQRNGSLWLFNPESGEEIGSVELEADDLRRDGSQAIGLTDRLVLAASDRALAAVDRRTGETGWTALLAPTEPEAYGTESVHTDGDVAVVETLWHETGRRDRPIVNRSGYGLQAVELGAGEVLWDHELYTPVGTPRSSIVEIPPFEVQGLSGTSPGFASGIIVAPRLDGHIEVLGTTAVSMGGPDVDTERFPALDENVTLDLSDTEPGAFGEATRYRVDWGDGTTSGWQTSPTFSHAYEEEGNVTARLYAGNEANQTASTLVTMRVGQTEPNFIETAFKRENQDATFGVLGLAVALGGGLITVVGRYRNRSRLQDELDALEEGFHDRRTRPAACEAFLAERKERTRALVLGGKLSEEQSRILEDRIAELKRQLRVEAIEERFEFMPYVLVKDAREMLEDGRVSSLEKSAFLQALREDNVLTDQQKAEVRERIKAWHERDTGGGRG